MELVAFSWGYPPCNSYFDPLTRQLVDAMKIGKKLSMILHAQFYVKFINSII